MLTELKNTLRSYINPQKAPLFPKYFKAGKGEYAEGDQFIGVTVPNIRKVAKQFQALPISDIKKLLYSRIHEERLTALFLLTQRYEKGDEEEKEKIYTFYVQHRKQVNHWDLVDQSACRIMGVHLLSAPDVNMLVELSQSENLWERRISIISTFAFIRQNRFEDTLKIAEILVNDSHDIIHKAVGWMLREVGKRNRAEEEKFLDKYHKKMPRTMLRYAIEHFDDKKKKHYMSR